MSLNWYWEDKMGEVTYENGSTDNLYRGNALVIAVAEADNKYCLTWFAADKNHLKNMLGLNKDYERCFEHFGITKLKLDTKYKETETIISLLAKAKAKLTIETY